MSDHDLNKFGSGGIRYPVRRVPRPTCRARRPGDPSWYAVAEGASGEAEQQLGDDSADDDEEEAVDAVADFGEITFEGAKAIGDDGAEGGRGHRLELQRVGGRRDGPRE